MTTPVIFKRDKGGDVFAAFPTLPGNMNQSTMSCYAHIGQHGTADSDYVRQAKPASPDEYSDLLRELRRMGYDDLKIIRRMQHGHYIARREART